MPTYTYRTLALALIGLLCLSTTLVHAQDTTVNPGSSSGVTPTPNTPSGTPTGTATGTATGTLTGTGIATPTPSLPPRTPADPVGGVIMDKPLPNNERYPPLFAIGTDIEFAWHYTEYLKLPPTNITIEAYMTNTPATIVPIGTALPGNTKNFTWTAAMQKNLTTPIATANYTLRIFDGAIGRAPVGQNLGGYLMPYAGLKFGLYIPGTYTPGNQQNPPVCATCEFSKITNGAMVAFPALSTLVLSVVVALSSIV
ncbi:hypothetical protein BGZ74_004929 [Mortierella antarctica]|nr:hypothetical protein BGZ74_004929 [Mortierella antarctica]